MKGSPRYSPAMKSTFLKIDAKLCAKLMLLCGVLISQGCTTLLKGREVSLRPERLAILESHTEQLASVKRLGVVVRKCPPSIGAEDALRNALGAATNFEIVEAGSKERQKDTLTVECTTAVERDGGALGSNRPAAIGLLANLASSNEVVWSARYFYRDKDVSSDVLALKDRFEVGGGGVKFSSLTELSHAGLNEIATSLGAARTENMMQKR